ncbi:hypothetical protein JD844_021716, partial [Phrynosoma platyrhinos]
VTRTGKLSEQKYAYCACAILRRNQLLHDRHYPQHVEIISVVAVRCTTGHLRGGKHHIAAGSCGIVIACGSASGRRHETLITGEGAQEEATQSPAAASQSSGQSVGNKSQQGAVVRRVAVRSIVRQVRADEDIPDRRARRGELIARTIIEDSRREGRLNRALARRCTTLFFRPCKGTRAMERD